MTGRLGERLNLRLGVTRRLAVTIAVACICCIYAGVAHAEDPVAPSSASEQAEGGVVSAAAELTTATDTPVESGTETSEPPSDVPETPVESGTATSEPPSDVPETPVESGTETSEPPSDVSETPVESGTATSEPPSDVSETPVESGTETSEPVRDTPNPAATPESVGGIPAVVITSPLAIGIDIFLPDTPSQISAAVSGDASSAAHSDRLARREPSTASGAPSPLPGPQAPGAAGGAGASSAPGGGSSGMFAALVAVLVLACLPFSRVIELALTRVRISGLVADVARPG
jgi:hypothetical protein